MVDKLLNKCNRVTGVMRCFHYVNIGHYLKLMAGWGTGEGVVGGYMHVSQIYICQLCATSKEVVFELSWSEHGTQMLPCCFEGTELEAKNRAKEAKRDIIQCSLLDSRNSQV